MVAALGGPADLVTNPTAHLRSAAVTQQVFPSQGGYVNAMNTRSVGLVVVTLGGGRMRGEDAVDHAVGLSDIAGLGDYVDNERPLAVVHARNDSEATIAANALRAAYSIGDAGPTSVPVVAMRITV
jgi:thymidine phosphorylase